MGVFKKIKDYLFDPDEMTPKRLFGAGLCVFFGIVNWIEFISSNGEATANRVIAIVFLALGVLIFVYRKSWLFR